MRRFAIVVAVGLVVAGMTACEPPGPWAGDGPRVAVVGDSLVYKAQNATTTGYDDPDTEHWLTDDLNAAGYSASVGGAIGFRIGGVVAMVDLVPEPAPEILVFAGGSNDANAQLDVNTAMAPLRDFLDTTAIPCIVLVTVSESPGDWNLDVKAPPINAALRAEAQARDNVIVADWTPVVAAHPEYVGSDGAHMLTPGKTAYRQLIVDGADDCQALR